MISVISIFRITDMLSHEKVRNCIDPASTDSYSCRCRSRIPSEC